MSAQGIVPAVTGTPPIVGKLELVLAALPDGELLTQLRGPRRMGGPRHAPEILWRRVRGHLKVAVHVLLSAIVAQASAVAFPATPRHNLGCASA
jgi:hypothetical protein